MTGGTWTGRSRRDLQDMKAEVDRLYPVAVRILVDAAASPNMLPVVQPGQLQYRLSLFTVYGLTGRAAILPELTEAYLTTHVRLRWKGSPRHSRTNATAYAWKHTVAFNPHALARWCQGTTLENFRARLLDLILHELAHLLAWHAHGESGHGRAWKMWGRIAGFVPFGRTNEGKKFRAALRLQLPRLSAAGLTTPRHEAPGYVTTQLVAASKEPKMNVMELEKKTLAELRDIAKGLGVAYADAKSFSNGKTPAKEHWIAAIIKAQGGTAKTATPKAKKAKTSKKTKTEKAAPKAKKAAAPKTEGRGEFTWRIAEVTSPKTGRTTTVRCRAGGFLFPTEAARTGIERVEEWWEVQSDSRLKLAKQRIAEGLGTHMTAEKYDAENQ